MRHADLPLGEDNLRLRTLTNDDAALLVEATSTEPKRSLWGPRLGPYAPPDAAAALAAWDPATGGQFSLGILHVDTLLGAIGLIPSHPESPEHPGSPDHPQGPEHPGDLELAYWLRPEQRGKGIASRAVLAATRWAHRDLAAPRVWLEIHPDNEPSLRLARRAGYQFRRHIPHHCRAWPHPDATRDTWHDCLIWTHEHTASDPPATR